jgi:hypothetical protein
MGGDGRLRAMGPRGRALAVFGLAIVPLAVLMAPHPGNHLQGTAAIGGPHSSMAGPTTFAAIGPTAIPASSVWDPILAVPTPGPTEPPIETLAPPSTRGPAASAKPAPKPTPAPMPKPTPAPTPKPAPCTVFPSDNVWNRRVDDLPVRANSDTLIASIGVDAYLHPDFSSTAWNDGLGYGIPINKVNLSTPKYGVTFDYADESDPGPYPIPAHPKIEGGSDAHLILWDTEGCDLYEIFAADKAGGQWYGGSGAIWNLRSNRLRPDGWTSADAAGLPILPGLARYDEVAAGAIRHALRFTAPQTCPNHIYPARHDAGDWSCATYPPMGLRVRLRASIDISGFGPQARVILLALKRYGMLLADNGSAWYVTGAPNAAWDDDQLHDFHQLHGSDFEVVDTSGFR